MADNLTTPVPDGATLATKDLGGVHIPKSTIVDQTGADAMGIAADSPGATTLLGRLKAITDALLGTLKISAEALPLPTGAATAAKQDDIIVAIGEIAAGGDATAANQVIANEALADIAGLLGNPLPVEGVFFPETQPVSVASLPLPTGAATDAGLTAIANALGETLTVEADALPLPSGAATSAKQDEATAAIEAVSLVDAPFAITPHATNALPRQIKAIAIVTGGDIAFRSPGASADATITLPAGLFPLPATHIRATSTAEGLTGF